MKKIFKYVTLVLAVVIVVAIASILVIRHNPGKNTEAFSDVRAYRTEVSPDTEIYDDNVAGDPFAYPMREELRNKSAEAFGIINAARQEQGLKPLAWDAALEYASHVRVNEIAVMFDKNHLRPNGTYWFTVEPSIILGENIYKGYGDAQKAMEGAREELNRSSRVYEQSKKDSWEIYKRDYMKYISDVNNGTT